MKGYQKKQESFLSWGIRYRLIIIVFLSKLMFFDQFTCDLRRDLFTLAISVFSYVLFWLEEDELPLLIGCLSEGRDLGRFMLPWSELDLWDAFKSTCSSLLLVSFSILPVSSASGTVWSFYSLLFHFWTFNDFHCFKQFLTNESNKNSFKLWSCMYFILHFIEKEANKHQYFRTYM